MNSATALLSGARMHPLVLERTAAIMKDLTDPLPILPFTTPAKGRVHIPGSKSITNRALLLAALCKQPVELRGALLSEDTELMEESLRKLGLDIEQGAEEGSLRITGQDKAFACGHAKLFVGLAGTAARFLSARCAAAASGVWQLDGVPQMRKRPMKGLIDALRALGADVRCTKAEGFFPLEIHSRGLSGGSVAIDARESSQLLSALLMVAPLAAKPVEITLVGGVRWPFVQMTARMMEQFGQPAIERTGPDTLRVASGHDYLPPAGVYDIEPDATAASYFLALPAVCGGELCLPSPGLSNQGLQGDTRFAEVLQATGVEIEKRDGALVVKHRKGSTLVARRTNFSEFSDTFLTLAALSPLLEGSTRIEGIKHTRKQETDRVSGMASELRKLGQEVVEEEDALTISPRPLKAGMEIETYGDHRFAMSFAILGCHDLLRNGKTWLSIRNPGCCAKTFPHFFELLETVRENSV
jgi:3-phosphoshikimate 1-carboxyvinyltransferase